MNTLTLSNIDDVTKDKLHQTASLHGRSMGEEVLAILRNALAQSAPSEGLGTRIHSRFAALGSMDWDANFDYKFERSRS